MAALHQVIVHRPGPRWLEGVDFREQPGVERHAGYYSALLDAGKVFMGGPFLDSTGGMFIMAAALSAEDVEKIAAEDPTVVDGLLEANVRPWLRAVTGS